MKGVSCRRPKERPGGNFLLPLVWLGSKSDFQVTNLPLATLNFEPCNSNEIFSKLKRFFARDFKRPHCNKELMLLILHYAIGGCNSTSLSLH